jgi:hypothetical protein
VRWQILIATVQPRTEHLRRLLRVLSPQLIPGQVEVLVYRDGFQRTIGFKRNHLIQSSVGEYINFVDDDDLVSDDYVPTILPLLDGVDTVTFDLAVSGGGYGEGRFRVSHSIHHTPGWYDDHRDVQIGHLCPMRRELHLLGRYGENFGDDAAWSSGVLRSNLVRTEHHIDRRLYTYLVSDGSLWRPHSRRRMSVSRHPPFGGVTYLMSEREACSLS